MSRGASGGAIPLSHLLLAVLVVAIWGTNFVVIHFGLAHFHALTFATLRFAVASFPFLPFLAWPHARGSRVILYGLLTGVGQFGLMLVAMQGHISPGLASVLIQAQAFFTVIIAVTMSGERLNRGNVLGVILCAAGVTMVALYAHGDADAFGIALVMAAALCWGFGNVVVRGIGKVNSLSLVAWSNLFAVPPLAAAALWSDGWAVIGESLRTAGPIAWSSALWQSLANAMFGYGAWNWLLARHPASSIAPLGLLVPFFGLGASAWVLGEALPAWKIAAALAVVSGLAVNILAQPGRSRRGAGKGARPVDPARSCTDHEHVT
jgi:O-acetylserine/cysteine efflux transporter